MKELLEGDYSLQVCDQCHGKRTKCDRELPTCYQCQSKGIDCSYNRKLKTNKPDLPHKISVLPLGRMFNQPTRKRRSKKELQQDAANVERKGASSSNRRLSLPRSKSGEIKEDQTRRELAQLNLSHTSPVIPYLISLNHSISTELHIRVLHMAVSTYFHRINTTFPLFIPSLFFRLPRSKLLMTTIYLCGLKLLAPPNRMVDLLINHYQGTLFKMIDLGQLKSLAGFQVLLINAYTGFELFPRLYNYLRLPLSKALGLFNRSSKKLPFAIIQERTLASIAMLQLNYHHDVPNEFFNLPPSLSYGIKPAPVKIDEKVTVFDFCIWKTSDVFYRTLWLLNHHPEKLLLKNPVQLQALEELQSLVTTKGCSANLYKTLQLTISNVQHYGNQIRLLLGLGNRFNEITNQWRIDLLAKINALPIQYTTPICNYYHTKFQFDVVSSIINHNLKSNSISVPYKDSGLVFQIQVIINRINLLKTAAATKSQLKGLCRAQILLYQAIVNPR